MTKTTTTKYTITKLNMSIHTADQGFEWALHSAGCADLDPRNHEDYTLAAYSAGDAAAEWVDEELIELGWSSSDVRVMPCAGLDQGPTREADAAVERGEARGEGPIHNEAIGYGEPVEDTSWDFVAWLDAS